MILTSVVVPTGAEGEGAIIKQQGNTKAFLEASEVGNGTLYITESAVTWVNSSAQGFSLDYRDISLHAVSRDTNAFPHQCLYLMLDKAMEEPTNGSTSSSDEEANDDCSPITQMRFVPADSSCLDDLFQALAHGQSLHPDEEDMSEDGGYEEDINEDEESAPYQVISDASEGQYFTDASGFDQLTDQGRATLERLEGLIISPENQSSTDQQTSEQTSDTQTPNTQANGDGSTGQFEDAD